MLGKLAACPTNVTSSGNVPAKHKALMTSSSFTPPSRSDVADPASLWHFDNKTQGVPINTAGG